MKLRDKLTETAEKVRYVLKDERYNINIGKKGIDVKKLRPTRHTIKWQSKNH